MGDLTEQHFRTFRGNLLQNICGTQAAILSKNSQPPTYSWEFPEMLRNTTYYKLFELKPLYRKNIQINVSRYYEKVFKSFLDEL